MGAPAVPDGSPSSLYFTAIPPFSHFYSICKAVMPCISIFFLYLFYIIFSFFNTFYIKNICYKSWFFLCYFCCYVFFYCFKNYIFFYLSSSLSSIRSIIISTADASSNAKMLSSLCVCFDVPFTPLFSFMHNGSISANLLFALIA